MAESARRRKAIILAGGLGARLYTVTLLVKKTIDWHCQNDDYLLA